MSATKMLEQVKIKDLDKLEGIIKRNLATCKVQDRTQFEYLKASFTLFASQNNIGIWVDSIEDPHALLVVTTGKFGILNEIFGFINMIYIDKKHRNTETVKAMMDTATMWSRAKNCQITQVSSWLYDDCPDVGDLWEALGYEVQETIYVKKI